MSKTVTDIRVATVIRSICFQVRLKSKNTVAGLLPALSMLPSERELSREINSIQTVRAS